MKAIVVHALLLLGKTALSVTLCWLSPSSLWCPLILFRLFGRLYPVLSGQMPSYHVVRRQGVSYSGHPGSVMWVVTGQIGGDGNSHSRQSPLCLLILVSWRQAATSIVVGLSLQIVDCCRVGALLGLKSPWSLSFPIRKCWTKSPRFHACNWHS